MDAVVHAYNWSEQNYRIPLAAEFARGSFRLHAKMSRPEHRLSQDEYIRDWSAEDLSQVVFDESCIDVAIYHSVPLDDYYWDGLISLEKGIEFQERHHGRVFLYAAVNPLDPVAAIQHIRHISDTTRVSGIKLYPVRFFDGNSIRIALDDRKRMFPIFEEVERLGIPTVAVHKAIPFGRTKQSHYSVDDIDEAAAAFPELNFEVVHAGMAFIEETGFLLGRHPNVYANLEVTSTLIANQPGRFADVLGHLLYWGGADKILFATGAHFVHPQPVIEAFGNFAFSERLEEEYGYSLSEEDRRKIFGGNAARLLGIDELDTLSRGGVVPSEAWSGLRSRT